MALLKSLCNPVAQPSWLWGRRASCPPTKEQSNRQDACLPYRLEAYAPPVPKLFNKAMLNQGLRFTVHGSRVTNPPLSGCPQPSKSNRQPSLKRALQKGASLRPTAEGRWLPVRLLSPLNDHPQSSLRPRPH